MLREFLNMLRSDNLLAQALSECHAMLDLCRPMVRSAVESLRQHDTAFEQVDVDALDHRLDNFKKDVRRKVVTHIALGNVGSTASGLALASTVIDIERIGDYSKNIVELARLHTGRLVAGAHEQQLAELETAVLDLLDDAIEAFKTQEPAKAEQVIATCRREVFRSWRHIERDLVSGNTQLSGSDAATVALYGRFLKRIGGHSRNMARAIAAPINELGED